LLVFLVISVPLGFAWSFFPIWLNRFGLVFLGVLMVTTVGEVLTIDASNPQMSLLRGSLLLAGIWVIALVVNDLRLGRNLGFLAMDLAVYLPWAALAVFLGWLSHD